MRPRIAIPVPTSFDQAYNDQCWPEYARAVEQAGGEAVGVPLDLAPIDVLAVAAACDGILLPGSGADVDPARYGQERLPKCNQSDPAREEVDFALLRYAEEHRKPTLCICFGTQSLNVHRGGTLVQHLNPVPVNHPAGRAVQAAHSLELFGDSIIAHIARPEMVDSKRLMVNSSHHQALAIAGDGLRVTARSSEDGVIEAVEGPPEGPFLLGVQWHPERTTETSATSRAILQRLIDEARKAAGF